MVEVWTDGGCNPNPGFGGWAAVVVRPGEAHVELVGTEPDTTNNRMELLAVIRGLQSLPVGIDVCVCLDSTYVANAFLKGWLAKWIAWNFERTGGMPVPNTDLWRELHSEVTRRRVRWRVIPGHSGEELNERCDELASAAIAEGRGDV